MQNEPFVLKANTHLCIHWWERLDPTLVVGMSTREGGYSKYPYTSLNLGLHVNDNKDDVVKNRQKIAEDLMFPLEKWVFCEQTHGNAIYKVEKKDRNLGATSLEGAIKGVDGLYTKEKQTMLATLYADCVPIYFYAPNYDLIGVAHAGWKGTVGNIVGNMVNKWVYEEGVKVTDIYTVIGPSISMEQYEVDDKVILEVNKVLTSSYPKPYIQLRNGKYKLNLKELNRQLLLQAGVLQDNIVVSSYCTSEDNYLFFSHRKENGKTGRMVSFIGFR